MRELYLTLENYKVGIFESPTGTGKSLSIICSALQWLRDNERKPRELAKTVQEQRQQPQPQAFTASGLTDWITEYKKKYEEEQRIMKEKEQMERIERQRKYLKRVRDNEIEYSSKVQKLFGDSLAEHSPVSKMDKLWPCDDDEFLLDDYESEEEESNKIERKSKNSVLRDIDELLDQSSNTINVEENENDIVVRKIFYCSRTHSQLSQFVNEIKKTKWADDVKVVCLGSRKALCVHPSVRRLPTLNQINDKCLDMMKSEKQRNNDSRSATVNHGELEKHPAAYSRCEYYNQNSQRFYRDHVLAQVRDIEELVHLGKQFHSCPYYGVRAAVPSAELVVMPYQMLLHKDTREALNIDLRDNIVIIDEAHNLIDVINNIYSVELDVIKISQAHAQLTQYKARYLSRLKAKNLAYIEKILFILASFLKYLESNSNDEVSSSGQSTIDQATITKIMALNDFLFVTHIDNINLFKLEKYIRRSEIVKKVNGFSESFEVKIKNFSTDTTIKVQVVAEEFSSHRPPLGAVESFLLALTHHNDDGRILVTIHTKEFKKSSLRFLLLNPETHFQEILREARTVVLAGGTLQPVADITQQLIGNSVPQYKIKHFVCSHIIPEENLLTLILDRGPTNVEFEFTWENRLSSAMMEELGHVIVNICSIVPDGVIVFFSSYQYEEQIHSFWKEKGIDKRIEAKKKIFREPKQTHKVEETLRAYATCIERNFPRSDAPTMYSGALLSCVVGGKMSEGINFSDGLGRCVIVVGMPYPNPKDPILKEKINYLSAKASAAHSNNNNAEKTNAKDIKSNIETEYFENICMKAVNQSIGRSIRHIKDYATIVLIDRRYRREHIIKKLPQWIASRMGDVQNFGHAFLKIANFFKQKRDFQLEIEEQRRKSQQ